MAELTEFNMEDLLRKAESKAKGQVGSKASAHEKRARKMVRYLAQKVRDCNEQCSSARCSRRRKRGLRLFLQNADVALRKYIYGGVNILSAVEESHLNLRKLEPLAAPAPKKPAKGKA